MLRLAPGHGTAKLAIALDQLLRQQCVRHATLGAHIGAGETQQHATLPHPCIHPITFRSGQCAIRRHQHRKRARQQRGGVAVPDFGDWLQGARHVEIGAEQRGVRAGRIQHPDRAPPRRLIQQRHTAGAGGLGQAQRAQLIAQLGRQIDARRAATGARRQLQACASQNAAIAGFGVHLLLPRLRYRRLSQHRHQPGRRGDGLQQAGRQRAAQFRHRTAPAQSRRERRIIRARHAVGHIHGGSRRHRGDGARRGAPIRAPRHRRERRQHGPQQCHRHRGRCVRRLCPRRRRQ